GYRLIVQYGRRTRHPDYPDVPTARELATTDAGRALIEFTEMPLLTMARAFAAPPGLQQDRAQAWRTAFYAPHRDPQCVDADTGVGVYGSPVAAEEFANSLEQMSRSPPPLFEQVRKLLDQGKGG